MGVSLRIHGYTQDPETKEYLILMQYANDGNLFSYLEKNINKLTWSIKLRYLHDIAARLSIIHGLGLIHCDLHAKNIILNREKGATLSNPYICDLGVSRPVNSQTSRYYGIKEYIAPEVWQNRQYLQASDIYSFGILMAHIATGEPPFRDKAMLDIHCGGSRPTLPASTPEPYEQLAGKCWDKDPNRRPTISEVLNTIKRLISEIDKDASLKKIWDERLDKSIKSLSQAEKMRYSSSSYEGMRKNRVLFIVINSKCIKNEFSINYVY